MTGQVEIIQQIRTYILSNFPAARRQEIGDEDSLFNSHIVDSTGILDLALYVEKSFGVTIQEEEFIAENFESIGALSRFVENKLVSR